MVGVRDPVDEPDRRVVQVRIEDQRVGVGVERGLDQLGYHRPLEVDPPLGLGRRGPGRLGEQRSRKRMERRFAPGHRVEAHHPHSVDVLLPAGKVSAQVTKSSARLVRTSTSHPLSPTRCSANARAAVSAPPMIVGP